MGSDNCRRISAAGWGRQIPGQGRIGGVDGQKWSSGRMIVKANMFAMKLLFSFMSE
jgi:hypothetical protein